MRHSNSFLALFFTAFFATCCFAARLFATRGFATLPAALLTGLLLLTSQQLKADAFYIGAGAYLADGELESFSDDDITPAGFIGYQFLDSNFLMLSVEGGYYDLGDFSGTVDEQPYSVDASALTAAGVVYVPIGPFIEVYGKLGVGWLDVEANIGDQRIENDGSDVFGGIGLALDIFDTIDIYTEYLQFDNAIDSRVIGVGIRLDFF